MYTIYWSTFVEWFSWGFMLLNVWIARSSITCVSFKKLPVKPKWLDQWSILITDLVYSFNSISGESIAFRNHGHTAVRTRSFNGGLAFTDRPLENESIFEIRIDNLDATWTGSLSVGVTSHVPLTRIPVQISELGNECVYLSGSSVFKGEAKVRGCSVSLDKLKVSR